MASFISSLFGFSSGETKIEEPARRISQEGSPKGGLKQPRRNSMEKEGWEGTFNPGRNIETKKIGSSKFDSGSASVWEVIDSADPAPILNATDKVPDRPERVSTSEPLVQSGTSTSKKSADGSAGLTQGAVNSQGDGYMRNSNMRKLGSSKFDGGKDAGSIWDEINKAGPGASTIVA